MINILILLCMCMCTFLIRTFYYVHYGFSRWMGYCFLTTTCQSKVVLCLAGSLKNGTSEALRIWGTTNYHWAAVKRCSFFSKQACAWDPSRKSQGTREMTWNIFTFLIQFLFSETFQVFGCTCTRGSAFLMEYMLKLWLDSRGEK